jgi:hypothetical protein
LIATDTRPTIATNLAVEITKTNEIVNKKSKTGKMTTVVKIMKVYASKLSNLQNASYRKMLNKPNRGNLFVPFLNSYIS